jgi:hypothetical protein
MEGVDKGRYRFQQEEIDLGKKAGNERRLAQLEVTEKERRYKLGCHDGLRVSGLCVFHSAAEPYRTSPFFPHRMPADRTFLPSIDLLTHVHSFLNSRVTPFPGSLAGCS